MKIFRVLSVIFICMTACVASANAAPTNGMRMPSAHDVFMGFEYNGLYERDMKIRGGKVESDNYFLTFSYGLTDWLSIDMAAGLGDVRYFQASSYDYDLSTNFAGKYGFRISPDLNLPWDLDMVTGFQHISIHPSSVTRDNTKYEAIVDDWQWSLLLGRFVTDKIRIYGGTKVSQLFLIEKVNDVRDRTGAGRHVGVVAGTEIFFPDCSLNIEGRFIDELAANVSVVFKY